MLYKVEHRVVNRLIVRIERVVIVNDQRYLAFRGRQRIDESGEQRHIREICRYVLFIGQPRGESAWRNPVKRGKQVGTEAGRIVVFLIQR